MYDIYCVHDLFQEVNSILENIVNRNRVRQSLTIKQQSYDAWRQVAEILLTACPEDLMPRDVRQKVLFELLQELLNKVNFYLKSKYNGIY